MTNGSGTPDEISVEGLIKRLEQRSDRVDPLKFAFLLGAGASVSSGIPAGREMVEEWIRELHLESTSPDKGQDPLKWARAETLQIPAFDPSDPAASYSQVFLRRYRDSKSDGYRYLRNKMEGAQPSLGYYVLGQLMAHGVFQLLLTTNFDDLAAEAITAVSEHHPFICGHESLIQFLPRDPRHPTILKIHRDLHFDPRNDPDEIKKLPEMTCSRLTEYFSTHGLIVVGYGGNDGGLMSVLEGLQEDTFRGHFYWCYRRTDGRPRRQIQDLIQKQRGRLVPMDGFDELMYQFHAALNLVNPENDVRRRTDGRLESIQQ